VHFERGQHPISGKDYCGANAVAVVSRSDFAMGKYTPQISDDIVIKISIEAFKQ
jgi:polyisoprenoid-binding protein YceI